MQQSYCPLVPRKARPEGLGRALPFLPGTECLKKIHFVIAKPRETVIEIATIRKVTRGSSVVSTGVLWRPRGRFLGKGGLERAVPRRGSEQHHDRANCNQKQKTVMETLGSQSHIQFISFQVRSRIGGAFATQPRIFSIHKFYS